MEAAEAAPGARHHHHHHHHHHRQQQHRRLLAAQQGRRDRQAHAAPADTGIPGLDVVRALHQTVISLRTALDSSREELRQLKEQQLDLSGEEYCLGEAVERLALENHVLRRRLLGRTGEFSSDAATSPPPTDETALAHQPASKKPSDMEADTNEAIEPQPSAGEDAEASTPEDRAAGGTAPQDQEEERMESQAASTPLEHNELEQSQQRPMTEAQHKLAGQGASNESENESEELDDIELIFTTEETCRDVGLQEDLVSITDTENWQQQQQQQQRTPGEPHKSPPKIGQAKSPDGEPVCNGANNAAGAEKASSVDEAASSQSSSIDREESVDRFDESSGSRLNKMWSQCSVLVETDISKCGVLEEIDHQTRHAARRNTLAAPTAAYRPIIHREALAAGRRKSAGPLRPMMDRSGAAGARRESGAQTDISALPAQWRSESYLAHKVAHTFTTLPSKFALPAGVPGRLRLSDKTREARRVMLSDISFTSMVPELSRSADHLCHEPHSQAGGPGGPEAEAEGGLARHAPLCLQFPPAHGSHHCFGSRAGPAGCWAGLRTPESSRRESWARLGGPAALPSPCDCRLYSAELCSAARYRGSLSSIPRAPSAVELGSSRRHSWRPGPGGSFDSCRGGPASLAGHGHCASPASPSGQSCAAGPAAHPARPTWSSVPSSPTHARPGPPPPAPPAGGLAARQLGSHQARRPRSKVTFQECPMIRGSLPNLRSESLAETSGDSTESLIDEAEDYLRRSIDSMLTFSTSAAERCAAGLGARHSARRRRARRHSEPDLFREWNPPQDARPYLPKKPQDLKMNHLVKVISPEGKILQGRVRYVGAVAGGDDAHVGVELPNNSGGNSDGTFNGRRYFDCEAERAIFVPFKKVVLAWCTT